MLSYAQIQQFKIDGYLVLPKVLSTTTVTQLRDLTNQHLQQRVEPFELEAEVQYPGAPISRSSLGGETIRRLRMAYQRDPAYEKSAKRPQITHSIKQILGCDRLYLNPNHHNCIMTKQAEFSSATLWHRDTRYWQFNNKYLVNAWFALGNEFQINGGMQILPGSHRWEVRDQALDSAQFLRPDHVDNVDRLATARAVDLGPGDVLLFSAHCFHAAGRNQTPDAKYSLVYTYHGSDTEAIENSTSATLPAILVAS